MEEKMKVQHERTVAMSQLHYVVILHGVVPYKQRRVGTTAEQKSLKSLLLPNSNSRTHSNFYICIIIQYYCMHIYIYIKFLGLKSNFTKLNLLTM